MIEAVAFEPVRFSIARPKMGRSLGSVFRRSLASNVGAGGGGPFDPNSIAGLIGWWKADSLALADNAAIATWPDSSTGAHDATQGTGANQPIFKTAIQNGQPVVRFNGTSQFLNTAMSAATLPFTVFAVCNPTTFAAVRTILGGQEATTGGLQWRLNAGKQEFIRQSVGAFGGPATTAESAATWVMTSLTCSGAGVWSIFSNGNANGTATNAQTFTAGTLSRIGVGVVGNAEFFLGDIGEILKYDSVLSSTDRQSVESYLRSKWGTP